MAIDVLWKALDVQPMAPQVTPVETSSATKRLAEEIDVTGEATEEEDDPTDEEIIEALRAMPRAVRRRLVTKTEPGQALGHGTLPSRAGLDVPVPPGTVP